MVYRYFFKACRDTLIELSQDDKYLGVTTGILMTLHTWGRQLNYHPHIHCLITSGGINKSNKWEPLVGKYLLPIRVVKKLFRGKLQAFIKEGLLTEQAQPPKGISLTSMLNIHRSVFKKEWSVRIQEKYEHGKGVVL